LHSKFRKADRAKLEEGLHRFKGVLVSTQVVEAGIDLDARTLITDVCPWSSLVQRCGRLGRNMTYKDADCFVVDVASALPYKQTHLQDTLNRLFGIADVSIHTLMGIKPPVEYSKKPTIDLPLLKQLFDVHNKEPISDLVRDIGNPSVYVSWRLKKNLHRHMEKPDQLELCSVMPNEFIKMEPKEAWIIDEDNSTRKQTCFKKVDWKNHKVEPGNIYIVPTTTKHYSKELGFILGCRRRVSEITQRTPKVRRAGGSYANAINKAFGLVGHSCDTANFAKKLTNEIDLTFKEYKDLVVLSAYLHDIGKAHPVFQETCFGQDPNNPLAKGDAYKRFANGQAYSRPGFRHEAASALQAMEWGLSPMVCWLLGSHHGQVITQFKSIKDDVDTEESCCGVRSGDVVPAVRGAWRRDIPRPTEIPIEAGSCFPETILRLPWEHSETWEQMFDDLWEEYGPLVLAALHTFVRIADHRASEFRTPVS
jgi:CRISPR-associated endonuclease/helicase Cas3